MARAGAFPGVDGDLSMVALGKLHTELRVAVLVAVGWVLHGCVSPKGHLFTVDPLSAPGITDLQSCSCCFIGKGWGYGGSIKGNGGAICFGSGNSID